MLLAPLGWALQAAGPQARPVPQRLRLLGRVAPVRDRKPVRDQCGAEIAAADRTAGEAPAIAVVARRPAGERAGADEARELAPGFLAARIRPVSDRAGLVQLRRVKPEEPDLGPVDPKRVAV